eukprot:gnl/TRDRNA2_/TRDRNA2_195770_c0_seq1.p1 gnl/TRDRNA2_/TRDRNA2_195770_c0~~gnl/TRDRNA2_/TRDRNA2_195770_c0_seq1.p1  ORF type:complete len:125 (+),score=11.99 gnl/TRDRNA2_/TRDRNA2_195770_c0_seq1:30-404(+)
MAATCVPTSRLKDGGGDGLPPSLEEQFCAFLAAGNEGALADVGGPLPSHCAPREKDHDAAGRSELSVCMGEEAGRQVSPTSRTVRSRAGRLKIRSMLVRRWKGRWERLAKSARRSRSRRAELGS